MTTKRTKTPRQRKVLRLIKRYIAQHGYAPTVREVSRALGGSELSARAHIEALQRKGYITRSAGKRHSLRVVGAKLPPAAHQPGIRVKVTARQRELLDVIERYTSEHGCPPAFGDLGEALGISANAVAEILESLRKKRRVTWVPQRARTLRVVPPKAAA